MATGPQYPQYPLTPYYAHHHHNTPAVWTNKTPYGYGSTSMVPFTGHGGFDISRAMANPIGFMDQMTRAMDDPTKFDHLVRNIERSMQHDMDRMMTMMPTMTTGADLAQHPARPASIIEHYTLTNPIRVDSEGNRWLTCCFDLRSFRPEEINVTLNSKERTISVEASHEVKDKDHYIKRHYSRKFLLPQTINADLTKLELKSCLTNEGMLCVESALPKITPEEASKMQTTTPSTFTVPITVKRVN